jgi:hypothetical protein
MLTGPAAAPTKRIRAEAFRIGPVGTVPGRAGHERLCVERSCAITRARCSPIAVPR